MTSARCEIKCTASEVFVRLESGDEASWWAFNTDPVTGKLSFTKRDFAPQSNTVVRSLSADCIYGAFQLLSGWYLAVVVKSRRVARGPYHVPIYQVEDMKWIPISRNQQTASHVSSHHDHEPLSAEEKEEEEM